MIAAVEAAGYVGATTEIPGLATEKHPYELARFEILGSPGRRRPRGTILRG